MQTIATVKNLHEHIVFLAKKVPDKTALLTCNEEGKILEEITFAQLSGHIESAASYLSGLSLKSGDRVALAFGNSAELLILSWAAWSTGIVTVPLDIKRDTAELHQYKIKLSNAKLLIAQNGVLKDSDKANLQGVKIIEFTDLPKSSDTKLAWKPGLSHEALILFTSGTTAYPKGAKLTLENLIVNAEGIREWLLIGKEDRFLVNLPLHHINSTTFCLSTFLAGGAIAIPPTYSNSHFWKQVAATHATFTSIVQSILFDQLSRGEEYSKAKEELKLNRIQIGSAPVVAQTAQEFIKKFRIPLYQGYGQTETALRVTGVPMGLPANIYEELVEKNSIGVPMSWADVQIADEEGKILGENKDGELVVKGPAVMDGYLGNEPAFRDGYFLTGDIGFYKKIDGKQLFYLKGRKKEIIIKGGINISPVAVENHLKKISHDISQVYVIGIPDSRYGEEVGAVICWKKDIDETSAKRRLKFTLLSGTPFLSAYETPKYITSISPEDLPTTSTGKVQRTILKKKLPIEQFESVYNFLQNGTYQFSILDPQSLYVSLSHELSNHCWSPLVVNIGKYKKDTHQQFILLALGDEGVLSGQVALIRTDLDDNALLNTTYDDLLKSDVSNPNGKAFVCVSICSAGFKSKPVPSVAKIPDAETVKEYLLEGHDPVFNFHKKTKGGQREGAALVGVIPAGRPEDKSSLGYTMLLKYSAPAENAVISNDAPVSDQLIEMVLVLAKDIGIKDVYAYSRPGGLAAFFAQQK
ncbi:MAG: class I adenylate-forming enzyme family protein [bacterium]|nr:class I adenylate-forming enzyme family protein [bacterium]